MIDKKAYTEVYKLIEILPEELKKKIPEDFIDVIKNNMDTSYKFEISVFTHLLLPQSEDFSL